MTTELHDNEILSLLQNTLHEKRLRHVLSCAAECDALGARFGAAGLLSDRERAWLHTAALLHDLTKEAKLEEQMELCRRFAIPLDAFAADAEKTLHARTGAALARERFGRTVVNDSIYNAIRWHTTGHTDMTLLEKLLYLADYIEPTRTFADCVTLRQAFYEGAGQAADADALLRHLDRILILSFDMTVRDLLANGKPIDPDTMAARNTLLWRCARLGNCEENHP